MQLVNTSLSFELILCLQDEISNFSGDSQDSRGYTSISVREPLSNIRSQAPAPIPKFNDSLYATLSDDSGEYYYGAFQFFWSFKKYIFAYVFAEEMYAAIEEASYAKISKDGSDLRLYRLGIEFFWSF